MIKDYEIRGQRGDETLFIYLDFDMEFAKLKGNAKKRKLNELISTFIKEKNIKFDGKKIAIISGGLLIATLMVKMPVNDRHLENINYEPKIVLVDNAGEESQLVEEKHPVIEETEIKKSESSIKENAQSKPNSTTKPTVTSPSKAPTQIKKPTTSMPAPSAPKEEITKPTTPPKVETPVVDDAIYVTIKKANGSLVKLELEEYVIGVVGAEMPASFNKEALKVQAVIARTYALRATERGGVLTDNSSTQNYKTNDQLRAMWGSMYQTYYQKIKSAVAETKGQYLTYNGVIIDAVYHSTSNGQTENAEYVWGNAFPYLTSVTSPYDESNSSFTKSVHLDYKTISSRLGVEVDEQTEINILSKTAGNRIEKVSFGETVLTGVVVRNKLGLRSADFNIVKDATGITFTTRGYGHGVGVSQYGANGMANHGYDYKSILKHYYKGISFSCL